MKGVILAGGGGTRLFPMSRENYPKQFLKLGSGVTLFEQTLNRLLMVMPINDIIVVTNEKYSGIITELLSEKGLLGYHLILEPEPRNTAPAVMLAMKYCLDVLECHMNEALLICPADHMIEDELKFVSVLEKAMACAEKDRMVTLSVTPTKPETGYGYIKKGLDFGIGFVVDKFVEKPTYEKAVEYLQSGNYFWNSGIYIFNIRCFMEVLDTHHSNELRFLMANSYENVLMEFSKLPNTSFDYAIAEKQKNMYSFYLDVNWSDIGSWDSVYEYFVSNEGENVTSGKVEVVDCQNSMILSDKHTIIGIGLKDTIIIEYDNIILAMERGRSQEIKQVIEKLGHLEGVKETSICRRPWGHFEILTNQPHYKVKKLTVKPGQILSYQMHEHRNEHWIVTSGTGTIIIDGETRKMSVNDQLFVPKHSKHRIQNNSNDLFELIEVQTGDYLEENDIHRFEDLYGRV